MKVTDPGHEYEVDTYDGDGSTMTIGFMKREGVGYPGNVGHYPGTNLQEILRVCIDRLEYLDNQIACNKNKKILMKLRSCIGMLESRAAKRHGKILMMPVPMWSKIETLLTCKICGHIKCNHLDNWEDN